MSIRKNQKLIIQTKDIIIAETELQAEVLLAEVVRKEKSRTKSNAGWFIKGALFGSVVVGALVLF